MVKQEIECPHCLKTFPIPTKRHYHGISRYKENATLCGINSKAGRLIAKPGKQVNCKTCLKKSLWKCRFCEEANSPAVYFCGKCFKNRKDASAA